MPAVCQEIGWRKTLRFATFVAMKSTAKTLVRPPTPTDIAARVDAIDWAQATGELDAQGCAVMKGLLSQDECGALAALYPDDKHFRSRIVMGAPRFRARRIPVFRLSAARPGRDSAHGAVSAARVHRQSLERSDGHRHRAIRETHADFLDRCHRAGQTRPTPLLLQYGAGDYNCLHQDLYGEHVFPLQVAFLLSEPGRDFTGGEFVLTEQRPRMQSRPEVVPLAQGDAVDLPCITGRCRARAGSTASTCAMALAGCGRAIAIRWALSSTTRNERDARDCRSVAPICLPHAYAPIARRDRPKAPCCSRICVRRSASARERSSDIVAAGAVSPHGHARRSSACRWR